MVIIANPMNYIDMKYISLLASVLKEFKRKTNTTWNFRCPFCGDSQKSKTKARGYIFPVDNKAVFKCHNCGKGSSLYNILKLVNPELLKEYVAERFLEGGKKKPERVSLKTRKPKSWLPEKSPLRKLKKISDLDPSHPAFKYIAKREIQSKFHAKLFYTDTFKAFVNTLEKDKFPNFDYDEKRVIIPFLDVDGNMFGFQGRSIYNAEPKYYTIMLDKEAPKVYGMERVDWSKPVIVVEGPIDSMFLENSIAMAGTDIKRLDVDSHFVFCYDNEPRNKEIVRHMEDVVTEGNSIVVFPPEVVEKDINDMVLAGMDVKSLIEENTFTDLEAHMRIAAWKKC